MSTGQADLEEAKHTSIALYEQTMAKISQELSLKLILKDSFAITFFIGNIHCHEVFFSQLLK